MNLADKHERTHERAELLKDIVYAANDGVITTFAVVAGVHGGGLSVVAVLILGFASLFADGFSMAVSNYLGNKSKKDFLEVREANLNMAGVPLRNSIVTFFSFVIVGVVPVLPFIPVFASSESFLYSMILAAVALFLVGALRTIFTRRNWFSSGLEMLVLGGLAAGIAYGVGFLIKSLVT